MATQAPAETDILCETCGYTLNGLPTSSNCPECGSPIDLSISQQWRTPTLWENQNDPRPRWRRFLITTAQIIFRPTRFYRSINSRGDLEPAFSFARIHWMLASILFGATGWLHWRTVLASVPQMVYSLIILPAACIVTYFLIRYTIRLAAWLTTLEATYRGYRLPIRVVRRAMYYNAAQLIPVGLVTLSTVAIYTFLESHSYLGLNSAIMYIWILAAKSSSPPVTFSSPTR